MQKARTIGFVSAALVFLAAAEVDPKTTDWAADELRFYDVAGQDNKMVTKGPRQIGVVLFMYIFRCSIRGALVAPT